MSFASTLKELRNQKHVTQKELAAYLNVSRPTIAGYETKNKQPDFDKLLRLSEYFHVSVDYLLTGKDSAYDAKPELAGYCTAADTRQEREQKARLMDYFEKLSNSSKSDVLEFTQLLSKRDQLREELK